MTDATTAPHFAQTFGRYVCVGDTIATEFEGLTITARIAFDSDTRPEDSGFDPGDDEYGEENARICESWKRDEWHYCGVVLAVSKAGVVLDSHAASLWGVECNFPFGNGEDPEKRNAYLTEVAHDLLLEAIERGRKALATTIAKLTS